MFPHTYKNFKLENFYSYLLILQIYRNNLIFKLVLFAKDYFFNILMHYNLALQLFLH